MFGLDMNNEIKYVINANSASGETSLTSFDRALMASGCGNYNLIKVSSILPARAIRTESISLNEGSLLPIAYACIIAGPDEHVGNSMSAAVAIGIPKEEDRVGIIMEYEGFYPEEIVREKAISMVKTAMKDRRISDYETLCASASTCSKTNEYDCVFAFVAFFGEESK